MMENDTVETSEAENNESVTVEESTDQKQSIIITSLITSIATFVILMLIFVLLFKPLDNISQNSQSIAAQQQQVDEIKQMITVSREELELQVRDYINKNYGELSERDEKVDKLVIYFRQQDARLSNIEKALSKF